jgi:hypothetical protein
MMTIKDKILHAVTEFDRRASTRKGHNPHALSIYFERVAQICEDIDNGADEREAILAGFSGRVADACLKAIGLPISTTEEARSGRVYYSPTAK